MARQDEQKKRILKALKDFGKISSAKISAIAGVNYNYLKILLKELEKEGKIKCEKAGKLATYWELK